MHENRNEQNTGTKTIKKIGRATYEVVVHFNENATETMQDKFDITMHKNYKLLEDYDKKDVFDIEDYIKRKGKVKMNRNTVITRL